MGDGDGAGGSAPPVTAAGAGLMIDTLRILEVRTRDSLRREKHVTIEEGAHDAADLSRKEFLVRIVRVSRLNKRRLWGPDRRLAGPLTGRSANLGVLVRAENDV